MLRKACPHLQTLCVHFCQSSFYGLIIADVAIKLMLNIQLSANAGKQAEDKQDDRNRRQKGNFRSELHEHDPIDNDTYDSNN